MVLEESQRFPDPALWEWAQMPCRDFTLRWLH